MSDIPRSHLSFFARIWEGTSGDRVITSRGTNYKGLAFAIVVPEWAYNQKANFTNDFESEVDEMIHVLEHFQVPLPYETIPGYLHRLQRDPGLVFMQYLENWIHFVA